MLSPQPPPCFSANANPPFPQLSDEVVEAHKKSLDIEAPAGTFAQMVARALNEEAVEIEVLEDGPGFPELKVVLKYKSLKGEGAEIRL